MCNRDRQFDETAEVERLIVFDQEFGSVLEDTKLQAHALAT